MSTYKINVTPPAQQFIDLLPSDWEMDLEHQVDLGVLGYIDIPLEDVSVNLRQKVQNFFGSMDYTLDDVEVDVSVSDLLNACQDKTGWSNTEVASQIVAEVMEWLDNEDDNSALIKKNNDLQIENARLRAVLKKGLEFGTIDRNDCMV